MIQIATLLPAISAGPARPMLLAAQSGASNFALAMSSLLVPGSAIKDAPGEAPVTDMAMAGLQIIAEPGKQLPEKIVLDSGGDEDAPGPNGETDDDAPAGEDLPFAWFALPAPPAPDPAPVAASVIAAKVTVATRPRAEIALPETALPDAPAPAQPKILETTPRAVKAEVALAKATRPAVEGEAMPLAPVDAPKAAPLPPRPADRPVAVMPRQGAVETPDAPASVTAAASPAPSLVTAPAAVPLTTVAPAAVTPVPSVTAPIAAHAPVSAAVMPAFEPTRPAVAPAIQPVLPAAEAPAPRTQAPDPVAQPLRQPAIESVRPLTVASLLAPVSVQGAPASPIAFVPPRRGFGDANQPGVTSIAAPSPAILQQVAASPDAQQASLDMRRHEWTGKMVEMIEAMRDAAPVKETRISLMPDALGKVDIAVRQEGDRVHVHFAAETQAARQILTDAQPRLTELAEARGIRLGQTSVDMGQGGTGQGGASAGQRHNETQRGQTPSAPARTRNTENQSTQTDDERVA